MSERSLWMGFARSADRFPDRPAVQVEGHELSYRELAARARSIAATLQERAPATGPALTAVFAYRTETAFRGILGALMAGHGYVPLNRTFPVDRTRVMLERSGCRSLIVDDESATQLDEVLEGIDERLLIIWPGRKHVDELREQWPRHVVLGGADLTAESKWVPPAVSDDAVAYLLFTSGSTGIPKGVMVAHRNVTAFIDYMVRRYRVTEDDRLSQMFDMTFDLSVFDLFVAWECGACVCCPTPKTLMSPGGFIRKQELTIWFSVPSTVVFMNRLGSLKPDRFPSLRWSLFCGEPLPVESTRAWAEAASNSQLENLYGPTELTIACMLYRWDPEKSPQECVHGVVPIGNPYPEMRAIVVDDRLQEVEPGRDGELLMTGPQLTLGYWNDPDKTAKAFVVPPGKRDVYYRTGDRVRRPRGEEPYTYLGRIDFQIKISGHRVELGEVESVVRESSGRDGVVALGWPLTPSGADGIEVFLEGPEKAGDELRRAVVTRLPSYMVPRRFIFLDKLPLNVNGKYDRKALLERLEAGEWR